MARAVHQELIANSDAIKTNISYLDQDTFGAKAQKEIVAPMLNLFTVAGDTAYLKGSFEYQSEEMAIKLRKLYSALYLVKRRIAQRELYRLTNAAMTNFDTRRIILNEGIKADLITQQVAIKNFIKELEKVRLVKV
jgi:hypothetical protein